MDLKLSQQFWTILVTLLICFRAVICDPVRVKMYDHRAEHDPNHLYGTGPWKYYGYGYGIEYQYEPNGTYQREKGYGYLKIFGRDFCKYKDTRRCRQGNPKFFKKLVKFNRGEPFWGQPSPDISRENEDMEKTSVPGAPGAKIHPNWLRSA